MLPPLPDPAGVFQRAPELEAIARANPSVRKAVARGNLHAVYRALWWARLRGRLGQHRATADALLAHRALFVTPARRSPVLTTMNGVGASVYGSSDRAPDGTYIKTHFLVLVFIPLFPLAQYLVQDAEQGWYFLGKVPMSTPFRIWNRLVVLGVFAAVLVGAFHALYWSRHHDVHVANGLPWPVHATIGDASYDVPPRERRVATVKTGRQPVRVTSAKGEPIESAELQVDGGTDVQVWNVLGASPLYERTVVYQSGSGQPSVPEPQFFCGERAVRRSGIDHAFTQPPQSIQMSKGASVTHRKHVDIAPGGLATCVSVIAGKPELALAVARVLAALDLSGDQLRTAVGLARAAGKPAEALLLAERALKQYPDSVEHHRLYQSIAEDLGKNAELVETYQARFAAAPDSPDAAYLYARLMPDGEGFRLALAFSAKHPDHIGLLRMIIYQHVRDRHFALALPPIEHLQALNRKEWLVFLDDHLAALAAVGRSDDAKKLAEDAFARNEGSQVQLAAIRAWLAGGTGPTADVLIAKLAAGDAKEQLALRIRSWVAPADANLATLAREPEAAFYRLMQHAHYDPAAALKDVPGTRAQDLAQLDPQIVILLLGWAAAPADAAARKQLEAVAERQQLPLAAVRGYLEEGTWGRSLENLTLGMHGALHLARSRKLPAREREALRSLARACDPLGGYVQMAHARWPPS